MLILRSDNGMSGISPRPPMTNRTVFTLSVLGSTLGNFVMRGMGGVTIRTRMNTVPVHYGNICLVKSRSSVNVLQTDK